jgi:hypothetical protein
MLYQPGVISPCNTMCQWVSTNISDLHPEFIGGLGKCTPSTWLWLDARFCIIFHLPIHIADYHILIYTTEWNRVFFWSFLCNLIVVSVWCHSMPHWCNNSHFPNWLHAFAHMQNMVQLQNSTNWSIRLCTVPLALPYRSVWCNPPMPWKMRSKYISLWLLAYN